MDFNGEINSSHIQWLVAGAIGFIFGISLWLRKRETMNATIKSLIVAALTYGVAATLYTLPLFFIQDADVLKYISFISNTLLYVVFGTSLYIARRIAPESMRLGIQRLTKVLFVFLIPAYLYSMYLYATFGVIDNQGEFRFPVDNILKFTESISTLMPLMTGLLLGYNTYLSKTDISKKAIFFTLSATIVSLSVLATLELISSDLQNEEGFAKLRTLLTFTLFAIISASILYVARSGKARKEV